MLKRINLILIIVLLSTKLNAQAPNKKWVQVLDSPEQSVYLDTTNIRQFENQISVLSQTTYKKPQIIPSINKETAFVKTQILFNVVTRKYSLIGNLYYDKELKIVGETSLPGFSANNENFSQSLDENEVMMRIFTMAYKFINKIDPPPPEEETYNVNALVDSLALSNSAKNSLQKDQSINDTKEKLISNHTAKDPSIKIINEIPKKTEPVKLKPNEEKAQTLNNKDYNSEAEINPKGTIFTDGSKYSFQVSSWRVKSKAESEVQRLKSEGYNAFIAEGFVRGNTWYRVRIGYFNSLEETEAYMKKVK
jgi:cell division septation protein DedD